MAEEGGIDMLVIMLASPQAHLQRQAAKALANLGVNSGNKQRICRAGGVPPLVRLAGSKNPEVAVEAVAALANLAVNGKRHSWGFCHTAFNCCVGRPHMDHCGWASISDVRLSSR